MGIRPDSTIGLLVLAVAFVAFGLLRLVNHDRTGWFLIAGGVLAIASAWWRVDHPPED